MSQSINKYVKIFKQISLNYTPPDLWMRYCFWADHFRARVETTADVIPHVRRPSSPGTVLYGVPLDMDGSAHRLCCHLQGKHTFYPVRLMLQPKTLAEVSYAEDRQSAATK